MARVAVVGLLAACEAPQSPVEEEEQVPHRSLVRRFEEVNPHAGRFVSVDSAAGFIAVEAWVERERSCETLFPLAFIRRNARTFRIELSRPRTPHEFSCETIAEWYFLEATFPLQSGTYAVTVEFVPVGATAPLVLFEGSATVT